MQHLDINTVNLTGLNIIEASAGTGKTYTLAELYLRLILEQGLSVEQILVVTYTRAATEELRERLRARLVQAKTATTTSTHNKQLSLAIQSFDEAAIFTIHGFCQRVLADFAFESGVDFEMTLLAADKKLVQQVVADFWRQKSAKMCPSMVSYIVQQKETPITLYQAIAPLLGKPYLTAEPIADGQLPLHDKKTRTLYTQLRDCWREEKSVLEQILLSGCLKATSYKPEKVAQWLITIEQWLTAKTLPDTLCDGIEKLSEPALTTGLKKGKVLAKAQFWTVCTDFITQYEQWQNAKALTFQSWRLEAWQFVEKTLPQYKQQQKIQSYDDLLLDLAKALQSRQGERLAQQLRTQYPAALIDEFQDTDPVQYANFIQIYHDDQCPVFFIGDPKQAIYRFRGAEIQTYLTAKAAAKNQYTLTTNWRSHPQLVTAVNLLFQQHRHPFLYPNIPFTAVKAARDEQPILQTQGEYRPLQFIYANSDKALTKQAMLHKAVETTANQIADILNQAKQGLATLSHEKTQQTSAVSGGDIAILVRSHHQAQCMQKALQARGVYSAQQGQATVWQSAEAGMMVHLLKAMMTPHDNRYLTAALTTALWDYTPGQLYTLQQDHALWQQQVALFHQIHQLWANYGFMRAWMYLMMQHNGYQQILKRPQGERVLTNLLHLAELIQAKSREYPNAMQGVLTWLQRCIQQNEEEETTQLRLESDAHLVQIMTIHKSKGLEFPIVFCPFLWDSPSRKKQSVVPFYDDTASAQYKVAFSEPSLSRAVDSAIEEEQAEALRLLYVALTRARERCIIFWGHVKGGEKTALAYLLYPNVSHWNEASCHHGLQQFVQSADTVTALSLLTTDPATEHIEPQQKSQRVTALFKGKIHSPWRISSFSALTHGSDAELPDHDNNERSVVINTPTQQAARFRFPRGATAGVCLHAILEKMAFDNAAHHPVVIKRYLLQYGYTTEWAEPVLHWLEAILQTPLSANKALCLAQLQQEKRLDELAFYFPIARLTGAGLYQQLQPYLSTHPVLAKTLAQQRFRTISGFMKGFIDLVFEHDEQYYIVDYKSNYLGQLPEDYQKPAIASVMVAHHYPLQYLIYLVALHRYLQLRLPDYDPDQHLGGVYYLFIRGMKPDWQQTGVYFERPDTTLILACDDYLSEHE